MNKEKACWYIPANNTEYRDGYLMEILPPTHEQIKPFSCVVMDAETGFLHHSGTVYMKSVGGKDLSKFHPSLRDSTPDAKDIPRLYIDEKELVLRKSNIGDLFWMTSKGSDKVHLVTLQDYKTEKLVTLTDPKKILIPIFTYNENPGNIQKFNIEEWYRTNIAKVYDSKGNIIQYSTSENTNP